MEAPGRMASLIVLFFILLLTPPHYSTYNRTYSVVMTQESAF